MSKENSFSAKAIRAGYDSSEHFNSVNPPIYQTASFDLQDIDRTRRLWTGAEAGGIYSRVGNPTAGILEARIAELEGGKAAVALLRFCFSVRVEGISFPDHPYTARQCFRS